MTQKLSLKKPFQDDNPRTFIFHHIGRSGGGDIDEICAQLYGTGGTFNVTRRRGYERLDHYLALSAAEKLQTKVITGHTSFGVHEFVPGSYAYFTILREPVDEFISQCNWYIKEELFKEDLGLESFSIEQYVEYAEKDDHDISRTATNWLATHWHGERTGKEERMAINEGCSEEIFELAVNHLENHYSFIGITENYAETIFLLAKMMKWERLIPYPQTNRLKKGVLTKADLSEELLERIKKIRFYDLQLYTLAKQWFSDLVAKEGVYDDPAFAAYLQAIAQAGNTSTPADSIYVREFKNK